MKVEKIKGFVIKHKKAVIAGSVICITLLIILHMFLFRGMMNAGEGRDAVNKNSSNINPRIEEIQKNGAIVLSETTNPSATQKAANKKSSNQKATVAASTAKPRTSNGQTATTASGERIQYATAEPVASPADYNSQWDQGYLVAIDNPDTSYSSGHIELTDEDRDLLERLCYGEFGGGGFVGASLIAQSVKNAMNVEGFSSVAEVISEYKYTGSTTSGKNLACQQAVKYVFDEDHDAVQHRLMYMYNPYMVSSAFHESQKFILSYEDVRFFDKW